MSVIQINYEEIQLSLSKEMVLLDQMFKEALSSKHNYLKKLHDHTLLSPGKRLRPTLLFLCSKMLEYKGNNHIIYATVFELIHTATLLHDDVIDVADTRRGHETLNSEEGNVLTILFGDLLYTKANTLAITAGSLEVMGLISSVTEEMIEGELLQEKHSFDIGMTEEDYFNILSRKTAFLFGGTAKAAGITAKCSSEQCEALYQYGYNLGISFQLVDDFLDYIGNKKQMGKPVLSDLQAGKMTLPVLRFLGENRTVAEPLIQKIWGNGSRTALEELAGLIRSSSSLEETIEMSKTYAEKAISQLDGFPDNHFKEILKYIPFQMLSRSK